MHDLAAGSRPIGAASVSTAPSRTAIDSYIDRYVPATADEALRGRARLMVWFAHIFFAVKLAYLAYAFSVGLVGPAIVATSSCVLMLAVLWFMRVRGAVQVAMHIMALGGWLLMTSIACMHGGVDAPILPWLVLVPTGAFFLMGKRAGRTWFLVCLMTAIALLALGLSGHIVKPELAADVVTSRRFVAFAGLSGLLVVMMGLYESNKTRMLAQIRAANHELAEARDNACAVASQLEAAQQKILTEARHHQALECELRQVHKLEAVNRLAAGVAHELNTPLQFVTDSVMFVDDATRGLTALIAHYRRQLASDVATPSMAALEEEHDLAYVLEQLPPSLERSLAGLERMATIVRAMRELASPDHADVVVLDVSHALEKTVSIAQSDFRAHADITLELAETPSIMCRAGEISQVFLSLLINASDAIAEKVAAAGGRGQITLRTSGHVDGVRVSISDTGVGISDTIRSKVFEPFFTTKAVGRGTGQGLSVARAIVVDKHGGSLDFTSEPGRGTRFEVFLPFRPFGASQALAA